MRIAKVLGNVTLSHAHSSFENCRLRLVMPVDLAQIEASVDRTALVRQCDELLVAWDQWGAGVGTWIALAEGPEAAQPFYPERKPIDAAIVALLDDVEVTIPQ